VTARGGVSTSITIIVPTPMRLAKVNNIVLTMTAP
jgi:hypothetical protein